MSSLEFAGLLSIPQALVVGLAVVLVAGIDLHKYMRGKHSHLLFACAVGTLLSALLLIGSKVFIGSGSYANSHMVALGAVVLVLGWKSLFGPWEADTKAGVLGTFVFWITFTILSRESAADRNVHLMALGVALIPAGIWCALFLKYHSERIGNVLLMFFAGMLSTLPILFYDNLLRKGVELQFFLFRLTPESFNSTSQGFVHGNLTGMTSMQSALMVTLVSFIIVGIIEEASKYWVVSRSGKTLFTSIDDVLELSIIAAIGFAFAENIVNPSYFSGFIREYLFGPQRDVLGFISNVMGRSVLTSMVHILSTGIMGYFLGLAIFAGPYLEERHAKGRGYRFLAAVHKALHIREISVFRFQMLATGFLLAVTFHTLFNFMVTVPEMLPMQPQTFGDLFGDKVPGFVGGIPLLLLPSVFYVVGGFWLLTALFMRKESMEERGHLVTAEVFVAQAAEEL